jgi:hypothetical protein
LPAGRPQEEVQSPEPPEESAAVQDSAVESVLVPLALGRRARPSSVAEADILDLGRESGWVAHLPLLAAAERALAAFVAQEQEQEIGRGSRIRSPGQGLDWAGVLTEARQDMRWARSWTGSNVVVSLSAGVWGPNFGYRFARLQSILCSRSLCTPLLLLFRVGVVGACFGDLFIGSVGSLCRLYSRCACEIFGVMDRSLLR